jgi:hypothetical protein
LPTPPWPTTAMFRIFAISVVMPASHGLRERLEISKKEDGTYVARMLPQRYASIPGVTAGAPGALREIYGS